MRRHTVGRSVTAVVALIWLVPAQGAVPPATKDWHTEKCRRYRTAFTHATQRLGSQGLGRDFLDRHAAFLASDCTARADVCPHSPEEFRLANIMVEMSMNFGSASTFAPFACR